MMKMKISNKCLFFTVLLLPLMSSCQSKSRSELTNTATTKEEKVVMSCICTQEYVPVCGEESGKTYGNQCEANCAGEKKITLGECTDMKKKK